jgi:hypothetical protein
MKAELTEMENETQSDDVCLIKTEKEIPQRTTDPGETAESASKKIKQEILSQQAFVRAQKCNSDVIFQESCLPEIIILSDEDDTDQSLIEALEDRDTNPFLRGINEGTQALECSPSIQGRVSVNSMETPEPRPSSPRSKIMKFNDTNPSDESTASRSDSIIRRLSFGLNENNSLRDSDLVATDTRSVRNCFTFAMQPSKVENSQCGTTSYSCSLNRVYFKKNSRFEISVNFPQFNIFNSIFTKKNIKTVLNMSDEKYETLMKLLDFTDQYEFKPQQKPRVHKGTTLCIAFEALDKFFSTHTISYSFFEIQVDQNGLSTNVAPIKTGGTNVNVTAAIDSFALSKLTELKQN